MNVKKMAQQDAARYIKAVTVRDEVFLKYDTLPNYAGAFDKTLKKLAVKAEPARAKHLKNLSEQLTKKPSHKGVVVALVVGAVAVGYYKGYDQKVIAWLKNQQAETRPAVEDTDAPA